MKADTFRFMEVLATSATFEEARVAVLKETVRQLEIEFVRLSMRKLEFGAFDEEMLHIDETIENLVKEKTHYQEVLATLQGGPHGS